MITTKIPILDLMKDVKNIKSWIKDDSGVLMASAPSAGIDWLKPFSALKKAVQEICDYRKANAVNAMVNNVPAGIIVPKHRDYLAPINGIKHPIVERWHLPLQTNERCFWSDSHHEGEELFMPLGVFSGPVCFWIEHWVSNLGTTDRFHLVVDLDILIPEEKY